MEAVVMGATPEPRTGDAMECRWCGKQITRDLHGWVDNTGFYNCHRLDQPPHAPYPGADVMGATPQPHKCEYRCVMLQEADPQCPVHHTWQDIQADEVKADVMAATLATARRVIEKLVRQAVTPGNHTLKWVIERLEQREGLTPDERALLSDTPNTEGRT